MDLYHLFGYLSTFSTVIPIVFGLIAFRYSLPRHKYFLFFLLLGFLVDCSKPFIHNSQYGQYIYLVYALIEPLFLFWYLGRVLGSEKEKIKSVTRIILIAVFSLWLITLYIVQSKEIKYNPPFDMIVSLGLSVNCVIVLLKMSRDSGELLKQGDFWFVSGIFFYFFCANFIFGLMDTGLLKQIWFIQNIIGIIGYAILARGFWLVRLSRIKSE
ncbi:MAG: hypothetical protein IPP51_08210 [Bacteroidetes bacterium]|nr:hypothetical protein [Bacteroidota bacterium]